MVSSEPEDIFEPRETGVGERPGWPMRVREWVLVDADRLVLTAILSIATFGGFLSLGDLGIITIVGGSSFIPLAGGMVAGSFSLVTLVVSINQLILSREFVAADEAERRLEGVISFRDDIANTAYVPTSPAMPARLLELLVATIDAQAETLASTVGDDEDQVARKVAQYTAEIRAGADQIDEILDQSAFGTFRALSATIEYDDSWQLYAARTLRGRHSDTLPEEAIEALDELIEALKLFRVAREHLKTTYLQRELTRFSQLTIVVGVPAILSAILLGFLYGNPGGQPIDTAYLPYVVSALVALVVSPLGLLASFILRTATMARRTASIGPMIPQTDSDEGLFDVQYGGDAE